MVLRADPESLAPERLMVFELKSDISSFAKAVQKVIGLDLVDEDEIDVDEGQSAHLYLMVPDLTALTSIESMWRRWLRGQPMERGFTPWRDIFSHLNDIRLWGPRDRLGEYHQGVLTDQIAFLDDNEFVSIEIEVVYRPNDIAAGDNENAVRAVIAARGGRVLDRSRITDIHYHALLVSLPVTEIRQIIGLSSDSIVGCEAVMHICPQSLATSIHTAEEEPAGPLAPVPTGVPILALLDGVPVSGHTDLAGRLDIDDAFGLEPSAVVTDRVHGTAMASLITRGDLNVNEPPLPRRIHVLPVLGARDQFPFDRLIVDMIYVAITRMLEGQDATAPYITIVNMSLGNARTLFDRKMSAWARLLDRLATKYGLLFVVSAGNHSDTFRLPGVRNWRDFEDADHTIRSTCTLSGIDARMGYRKLMSPAESINSLTIGASNDDNVSSVDRRLTANLNPYPILRMPNPSSALGPGFANSIKPDLLFPGGKEHIAMSQSGGELHVGVATPARAHGLKVAGPPRGGNENLRTHSGNTSGATALASRTCHRIHDALELAYGDEFLRLSKHSRSVLIKALIVHTAAWPEATATFIKSILGPDDPKQSYRQRDNIKRHIGYGFADPDLAISCAADRATFWAIGELYAEKGVEISVPIPACMGAQLRPHSVQATLAWLTPVSSGRKAYRNIRLRIEDPAMMPSLGVAPAQSQPDTFQAWRGTVYSKTWTGNNPAIVTPDHFLKFWVQRQPDLTSENKDDAVKFALAVTVAMPGQMQIYEQVRERVQPVPSVRP